MLLQLIIVLGGFPRMVAQVYYPAVEDCSDNYCLFLYRWQLYPQYWWAVNEYCKHKGMSLVSVLNRDVQSRVESLIQTAMTSEDIDKVWIGAQQNILSAVWQYLDGGTVAYNIWRMLVQYSSYNRNCVYVTCTHPSVEYFTDNCAEENGNHRTVCQFPIKGKNDSTDNNYGPLNYVVYDETDDDDWFATRSRCHDDGGDLIHTSNLDDTQMGQICNSVGHNQTFWFGINRFPWKWDTIDRKVDMLYSNWISDTDRDDDYDECVYVDTQNKYQWDKTFCSTYITASICMNGSIPEKTLVTMVTTTSTSPTVSIHHTSSEAKTTTDANLMLTLVTLVTQLTSAEAKTTTDADLASIVIVSTTAEEEGGGFQLYYIAVLVVGVIILLTLRKRKQIPREPFHNPVPSVDHDNGLILLLRGFSQP